MFIRTVMIVRGYVIIFTTEESSSDFHVSFFWPLPPAWLRPQWFGMSLTRHANPHDADSVSRNKIWRYAPRFAIVYHFPEYISLTIFAISYAYARTNITPQMFNISCNRQNFNNNTCQKLENFLKNIFLYKYLLPNRTYCLKGTHKKRDNSYDMYIYIVTALCEKSLSIISFIVERQ